MDYLSCVKDRLNSRDLPLLLSAHKLQPCREGGLRCPRPRRSRAGGPAHRRHPVPAGSLRGGAKPGAGLLLDLLISATDRHLRSVPLILASPLDNAHAAVQVSGPPEGSVYLPGKTRPHLVQTEKRLSRSGLFSELVWWVWFGFGLFLFVCFGCCCCFSLEITQLDKSS